MQNNATYFTHLGCVALITVGGVYLAWLVMRGLTIIFGSREKSVDDHLVDMHLAALDEDRPDEGPPEEPGYPEEVKEEAEDNREVSIASHVAQAAARMESIKGVLAVRCPVCKSPDGVTCNPELPEEMEVLHLAPYLFAHGLRVIKAVGEGSLPLEDALELVPEAEHLGDQIRKGLADAPAGPA